ncbi:MAG: DUF805 domain-containing protein [Brevundimonas sp.]|uniref:DUF805 domain-containing protein n=1 Tax=Brevundimonas sp. TaxID=1871086 RepID=UPI002625268A|nr:DUF805 domain-containing protein [Brevundimonas sp.]MDI6624728.1 DUF805 domain-containing protein [Brevundimonas sp.]MDQ7812748.1 DUF805 domain-containing protein [Brevundimonas sp.]
MIQAIGDALAFRGRLTRLGYWRWQMALVVISAMIAYGAVAVAISGGPRWLSALVFAPMVIAVIAAVGVVARRLQDRGRGVAWLLLFLLAPWGLAALSVWLSEGPAFLEHSWAGPTSLAVGLLSLLFNLWAFVEIGLLRGHPGPNRFGPPPE